MKNQWIFYLFILNVIQPFLINGQADLPNDQRTLTSETSHTFNFDSPPKWTSVDLQTHTLFYYDGEKVSSYDYINKRKNWQVPLEKYARAEYSYDLQSPNLILTDEKNWSIHKKFNKAVVINRKTGNIVFNSYDCDVFDKSQVHFSKDHQYVLLVRIEKIKKDKKRGIPKQVNEYLSLVKLGNSQALWTVKLPNDSIPRTGVGSLFVENYDFKFGPVVNDEVAVFSYGHSLYAYSVSDGSILWKKNISNKTIRFVKLPGFAYQQKGFIVGYNPDENNQYGLDFLRFSDGTSLWEKPVNLGTYFSVSYGAEEMMVTSSEGFNYVSYEGQLKWPNSIRFRGEVKEVYQQNEGYLFIEKKAPILGGESYGVNWLDNNRQLAFTSSMPIASTTLREGVNLDGYLILVTDEGIYTFNTDEGKFITKIPLHPAHSFAINTSNKSILFSDFKGAYKLEENRKEPVPIVDRIAFNSRKDTVWRVENFDEHYSFISREEMLQYDLMGNEINRIHFKPPTEVGKKILRSLVTVGALVLGTHYQNEIREVNRMAYQDGLIDSKTYNSNAYNIYSFRGLGAAAAVQNTIYSLADKLGKEEADLQKKRYERLDRLWIHQDKLDEGGWGLRIVDTQSGEEIHQIRLGNNKNFTYVVDEEAGILISEKKGEILFFDLF